MEDYKPLYSFVFKRMKMKKEKRRRRGDRKENED